jgi:hypothetical protein
MFPYYIIFRVPITSMLNFCRFIRPTYECHICHQMIGGNGNLQRHIKAKHTRKEVFQSTQKSTVPNYGRVLIFLTWQCIGNFIFS